MGSICIRNPETGETIGDNCPEDITGNLIQYLLDTGNYTAIVNEAGVYSVSPISEDDKIKSDVTSDDSSTIETNTNVGTTLLEVLKTRDINNSSHMKSQNELLKNQNDLIKKTNDIQASLVNEIKIQNQINATLVTATFENARETKLQTVMLNEHNNYSTANNIMQYQKADFEVNGVGVDGTILKDSNDDDIIPMHEQAKYHAEKHIDEKRANTTDIMPMLQSLEDDHLDSSIDVDIMSNVIKDMFESVSLDSVPNNLKEEI